MTNSKHIISELRKRGLLDEVERICSEHHVLLSEVTADIRTKRVSTCRHACWRYLRSLGFSYPEVGTLWLVNHTSVMYALKRRSS